MKLKFYLAKKAMLGFYFRILSDSLSNDFESCLVDQTELGFYNWLHRSHYEPTHHCVPKSILLLASHTSY
jgi:hypothetical protein